MVARFCREIEHVLSDSRIWRQKNLAIDCMTDAPETEASFLAPVSGAGFWTVCQGYKDRLQSHQAHLTVLQAYTCTQYTIIHIIHSKMHSEMGLVRQNPIQRTVSLFICLCIALCRIVAHNIAQNSPDSFPPYPPDDHHCFDDVYLREGGLSYIARCLAIQCLVDKQTHSSIHTNRI